MHQTSFYLSPVMLRVEVKDRTTYDKRNYVPIFNIYFIVDSIRRYQYLKKTMEGVLKLQIHFKTTKLGTLL
jgi:hypothetical protein